jgi:hypothetical protein
MEIMLRCTVPDRPGALATLAGAIGEAHGDIQAMDVVETADGLALDDLVVVVDGPDGLRQLVERVGDLDGVELIHAGPSRGHPGDAVARLAVSFEHLLNGAMTADHAVVAIVGGLLRAASARLVEAADAPRPAARRLVLAVDHRYLLVTRDYRFTRTEQERAEALVRAVAEAARSRTTAVG